MKTKKILIIFTIIILFSNFLPNISLLQANPNSDFPYQSTDPEIQNAISFLRNNQGDDGNIGGVSISPYVAMAISSANENLEEWKELIDYLESKSSTLDNGKATDWERHTLGITAFEKDPRAFSNINFVNKIKSFYDGEQIGSKSNLYDDYFGILALISSGLNKDKDIIQNTKSFIIQNQDSNGGWIDADSTAAAIMALISAGEDKDSEAINNALDFLKTLQTEDGGFSSWGTTNSASTAWAVMAINSCGKNPTASNWEKNGNNPIDYLISLQNEDGSFKWSIDQNMNPVWMTSYIVPALLGKTYPVFICEENEEDEDDSKNKKSKVNNPPIWTGRVRIEGKNETLYDKETTVSATKFKARKVGNGILFDYEIKYPTILGAAIQACRNAELSYSIDYYQDSEIWVLSSIEDDFDFWHYFSDYEKPLEAASNYELSNEDDIVLWGHLETEDPKALKISLNKTNIEKKENVEVSVFNNSGYGVNNATVYLGFKTYKTDVNGKINISMNQSGVYNVYSEKQEYIRSEKIKLKVKKEINIIKPESNSLYIFDYRLLRSLKDIWIFGALDIEVEASENIDKVEFYVNDELVFPDEEKPFEYKLNERSFFKKIIVTVKAFKKESTNISIDNRIEKLEKLFSRYEINLDVYLIEKAIINNPSEEYIEVDSDSKEIFLFNLFPKMHEIF